VRAFFLHRPERRTLIEFATAEERRAYSYRILQRLDIDPEAYSVLNVHRIGIDAPVSYVFNELLRWSGEARCWPNHIATVDPFDEALRHIRIRPLGLGAPGRWSWLRVPPLFDLDAIKFQRVPTEGEMDNARYLLYACSGGYPIGFFAMFVRSPIEAQGEVEAAQFFMGVGFDFYGKKRGWLFRPVDRFWEAIHNRVTGNVLIRFKQLCEWSFQHDGRAH
jgi:hypothetical protein